MASGLDEIKVLSEMLKSSADKPTCRIMENQGDYSKILTITPYEGAPAKLQLSLYADYPTRLPDVYVKSDPKAHLPESEREEIRLQLVALTEKLQKTPVLKQLVEEFRRLLQNRPAFEYSAPSNTFPEDKCEKGDAVKSEGQVDSSPEKLGRLRTAADVVSRIRWDDRLDQSCFTVGYIDRFAGVVEEKFNAFCWDQPLSAVDNDTLAIPQHRIQYFKYKQVKVWDKNERLDLVFGSTGDGTDIYALVDQFEDAVDNAKANAEADSKESRSPAVSDDEIDFDDLLAREPTEKKYPNLNRPNFFVAVRITNPEILAKAQAIADHITNIEPQFKICCLPSNCLHITLGTLRLNDLSDITHAVSVLHGMRSKLKEFFPDPIELEINKLDNFYNNVLYAKVERNIKFEQFADKVRGNLEAGGVKIVDNHGFIPHMTLMKITRPIQRQFARSRRIDPNLYHAFDKTEFGKQVVEKIYLCPIGVDRREDGFYQTVMEMDL